MSNMQPGEAGRSTLNRAKSVSMQLAIIESVENLHAIRSSNKVIPDSSKIRAANKDGS